MKTLMEIDIAIKKLSSTIESIYCKYDPFHDAPIGYEINYSQEEKDIISRCERMIKRLYAEEIKRIEILAS